MVWLYDPSPSTSTLLNMAGLASPEHIDINAANDLSDSLASVTLEDNAGDDAPGETTPRLLHVYTRPQLLYLAKSPLVRVPDNMPPLKDWFG